MTARKQMLLPKGDRPPAYVDRETGAAELRISPETWDKWVDRGILPPKSPQFPDGTPRWRWAEVDQKLSGKVSQDVDPYAAAADKIRHGEKKERVRAVS